MRSSVIVLSEVAIGTADAARAMEYLGLDTAEEEEPVRVRTIVPQDTERSLIAEFIDRLAMIDLKGAWEAITDRHRHDPEPARRSATAVLAAVEDSFRRVGCEVTGELSADDPLPSIREALEDCGTQSVVVFSNPQLLEETFAQDWAHRVEDALSATVLHLYPGSGAIGTA